MATRVKGQEDPHHAGAADGAVAGREDPGGRGPDQLPIGGPRGPRGLSQAAQAGGPVMRGQGRVFQREYRDKRTREVKIAATFTLEYYLDGEMRREASGTTSYTEAVRQLKRRQGEIAQGRRVDPAGDRLTFDQLAAGLVNDYRANGRRTLERVEDAIGHLRATFSGYRARAIDGALVTKYVVDRQTAGGRERHGQPRAGGVEADVSAGRRKAWRLPPDHPHAQGGQRPPRLLRAAPVRGAARPFPRRSSACDQHGLHHWLADQVRAIQPPAAPCRSRGWLAAS